MMMMKAFRSPAQRSDPYYRQAVSTCSNSSKLSKAVFSVLGTTCIRDTVSETIRGCTWTRHAISRCVQCPWTHLDPRTPILGPSAGIDGSHNRLGICLCHALISHNFSFLSFSTSLLCRRSSASRSLSSSPDALEDSFARCWRFWKASSLSCCSRASSSRTFFFPYQIITNHDFFGEIPILPERSDLVIHSHILEISAVWCQTHGQRYCITYLLGLGRQTTKKSSR